MNALMTVAMFIAVAVVTPGPNNALVLQSGVVGGVRGAVPAILAILLGTIIQAIVASEAIALLSEHAWVLEVIVALGSCYLAWMAARLVRQAWVEATPGAPAPPSMTAAAVFLLQFVNPKGWLTMLTATATVHAARLPHAQAWVLALYLQLSLPALLLWAAVGARLAHWLAEPARRRRFDVCMGLLLGVCAFQLLAGLVA